MRPLLSLFLICASLLAAPSAGAQTLSASRVWPSPESTRVTLEAPARIAHRFFQLENPARLVVDLEGLDGSAALDTLTQAVQASDPLVRAIRSGVNRPGVVRLVIDLKAAVKSSVFELPPNASNGHRLVIDLVPVTHGSLAALAEFSPPIPVPPPAQASGSPTVPETFLAQKSPVPTLPQSAASITPTAPPAVSARPVYDRLVTIVIDAGHGGADPGALGAAGSREKDITLALARKLKARFDNEPNMHGVLTRDGDYFVPLPQRVVKARAARADLFLSIHADAFIKPHARGSSVFALSEGSASSVAARWLAKKENDADLIGGVNLDVKDQHLKRTLLDLTQTATIEHSLKLGSAVLKKVGGVNTLHKHHVEQAGFAVLKAPDIPSILVETAFISNPEEEKKLNDAGYQDELVEAIVEGVKDYLAKHPVGAPARLTLNP